MSRRPARFTEADIGRAMRAVEKNGGRFEIRVEPDGAIRIVPIDGQKAPSTAKVEPEDEFVL
jgi:hypothetical protein